MQTQTHDSSSAIESTYKVIAPDNNRSAYVAAEIANALTDVADKSGDAATQPRMVALGTVSELLRIAARCCKSACRFRNDFFEEDADLIDISTVLD